MRAQLLVLFVALAGCHTSFTPAPEPDAGPPIDPLRSFLDAWAEELCRRGVECEPELDDSDWSWDQGYCHPYYATSDYHIDHAERGDLRFDAEAAEECLRRLREGRGCVRDEEWWCGAFVPSLREGQPCEWADDWCSEGLYCDHRTCVCERGGPLHADCSDGSGCGVGSRCWWRTHTCELLPGVGAPCETGLDCEDDALFCRDGECAALGELSPGDPCVGLFECGPDLTCQWAPDPRDGLRCAVPLGEGQPCSLHECGHGLDCIDDVCQRLQIEGEPCAHPWECDPSAAYCVDGRCTADAEGARCRPGLSPPETWACPEGLRCSTEGGDFEGACVRVVEPGGACSVSEQCPLAQRCVDGRCVDVVMPDEPCGPSALCPRTHVCEGGRCVPLPIFGERCDPTHPCLEGACVDGRCARLPAGSRCSSGSECEDGCIDGVCGRPAGEGASCGWDESHCGQDLWCTYGSAEPTCVRTCASR